MNRIIKIVLSAMIVSLCMLFVPLKGHNENVKIESIAVQAIVVEPVESNIIEYVEDIPVILNFELDTAIEEMKYEMTEIENIQDKKEWFIAYKNIIDKYSYMIEPPESIYDCFTEEELDLLFHVVQAEIGDEYSFEQKVNVASVIFNRLEHDRFPDTLEEILVASQFSTISNGRCQKVEVSDATILACEYAFSIQDTTNGCLFFDSNNTLNYQFIFNDAAHNFYKLHDE